MPTAGSNGGPNLDGGDAAAQPGNTVLPQPRQLGSEQGRPVVAEGPLPPMQPPHHSVPREFEKMTLPPYVVEPPDILLIQASTGSRCVCRPSMDRIWSGPDGTINLGIYGKVRVAGLTLDQVADVVRFTAVGNHAGPEGTQAAGRQGQG